jgi:hypothetical protein
MKQVRLVGILLVGCLAMGLVTASMALASAPEFTPTGQTFTASGGTAKLAAAGAESEIICSTTTSSTGKVSSATLAGGFVIEFTGCTDSRNGGSTFCTTKSPGAAEGQIITNTLHGILGVILEPPGTADGVGLLLLPGSGSSFVTIEKNSCGTETTVTGSVAGEVLPIGKSQKTGKLVFGVSGGKQKIKDIDLSGGPLVKPALTAFTATATEEAEAEITFSATTEVT